MTGPPSLLAVGATCWRKSRADRASLLLDMADYFKAAKVAILNAKRSVHFLNWAFDPTTYFHPEPGCTGPENDQIGPFLRTLACERPELDIRILCWKSSLPIAATQNFFPHRARKCFNGTPVRFVLDSTVPLGACHHQKMIVIDDMIGFCGGGDIGPDRWDTPEHLDDDPRRHKTEGKGKCYESRHELMGLVDGAAAADLGALFRLRWRDATGETLPDFSPVESGHDPWPDCVEPDFQDIQVGLSRTVPKWRDRPDVRECQRLHLAAIGAAEHCIYLENQYFTSPLMAEALAARLEEPDGPEVVIISTAHSPSWFDQMTMDRTRSLFLQRLQASDHHGRLRAYAPVTAKGRTIIVHSKLAIIDDRLLRIGSANMNNRSAGFDTECDMSIEATTKAGRAKVVALRNRLIAHWLGETEETVEAAHRKAGCATRMIDALQLEQRGRLRPIQPRPIGPFANFVATFHLGDPANPRDSWRPWGRRRALEEQLAQRARELDRVGLESPVEELSPETV